MDKPSLPKGTRDFGPAVMAKRQFLIETIKGVFKKFGFAPLETPAMENLSTLTGKYGEEGDQLLFKVLDSGDFYKEIQSDQNENHEFMRGFQVALKNLCDLIFRNLNEQDIRNWAVIKNYIESENLELAFFANPSNHEIRNLLKEFFQTESVITSINLVQFFIDAQLYKDNYLEKRDHSFQQFIDNVIIKGYGKILDNFLRSKLSSAKVSRMISEKGLRYDLTVPFARYVVMNRHDISLPFKRYQVQPVWRADRPQKGRYREFYQYDADVVGTDSLLCETEILLMIKEAFLKLGINDYTIKINHRGVLSGLAEIAGLKDNETTLFVAIDKLDKIGEGGVRKELEEKGVGADKIDKVFNVLNAPNPEIDLLATESGKKGLDDLNKVIDFLKSYGATEEHVDLDIKLARGLSYYTGCIFEVKINNVAIGSVSGGGRYDNLTQAFGSKEKLSGVGISFGIDRIYDAMEELKAFPEDTEVSSQVLICHFDEACMTYGLSALHTLRQNNIASEIYPDLTKKVNKQLEYADKKMIPYTIMIGADEMQSGLLTIKNMRSGEQLKKTLADIIKMVK